MSCSTRSLWVYVCPYIRRESHVVRMEVGLVLYIKSPSVFWLEELVFLQLHRIDIYWPPFCWLFSDSSGISLFLFLMFSSFVISRLSLQWYSSIPLSCLFLVICYWLFNKAEVKGTDPHPMLLTPPDLNYSQPIADWTCYQY